MQNRRILIPILLILILIIAGGWYLIQQNKTTTISPLQGFGTVETTEVIVSPEVVGRVVEVLASEGDAVKAGDPLFRLDDALLKAQRKEAETALASAQAGLETSNASLELAQVSLDSAHIQYQLELNNAHLQEQPARSNAWEATQPTEFDQPVWYFTHSEEISATQTEADAAKAALDAEKANYDTVLANSGISGLAEAEKRLADAQASFRVAKDVLDRTQSQGNATLRNQAQSSFDAAKAELDAAQRDYDQLLTDQATTDILEARARLAVAQERYDTALDRYNALLTGSYSLRVQAANAAVTQAEKNLTQAQTKVTQSQTAIDQAQAQLDLIDVQLKKLVVYAAVPGVILSRGIEPGEVVQPGAAAMTIGRLDELTITIYLPEDRYGEVALGDKASVAVDSYPGETFSATVTHIADQAEYTPRNVQTDEGRRTTVYAVKLTVDNLDGKLKPGMPADVTFGK